ncbi:MAG TPA: IS200/IS605 family transposase [Bacteroidia bacterium]|nr:IS200/IS605 family transposase [Bacteroidia bacterium]
MKSKEHRVGTYSQIYLQVVFAVKGRQNLLLKPWRDEVFKYISGIITAKGCKSIIVNGVEDHVHCFIGFKPAASISDLVRDIKNNSSKFISERGFVKGKFRWQEGYGVFSYSQSHVGNVYKYILNQEEHHKKQTFEREYKEFLKAFEIEHNDEYLFEWYDDGGGGGG